MAFDKTQNAPITGKNKKIKEIFCKNDTFLAFSHQKAIKYKKSGK